MRAVSLLVLLGLFPLLAASAGRAAAPDEAKACAALTGQAIAADTVIESAQYLPDGGMVGTTKVALPFCRVIGVARPTSDSRIGFEVWLPPATAWNGKFQGE